MHKSSLTLLYFLMIICAPIIASAQTDSTDYYSNELISARTENDAFKTWQICKDYYTKINDTRFLQDSKLFLQAAAASPFKRKLFFYAIEFFIAESKKRNLENTYIVSIFKFQNDIAFSDPIIQNQLNYYYSQFNYHLEEYYAAEKYCKLFLSNPEQYFPEPDAENIQLNAMTTLAFIYRNTNKIDEAINQLQVVLDSCRSKKKLFWEGLTLGNIANCYYRQKKYDQAIPFILQDIYLSRQAGELGSTVHSLLLLGNIYLQKNLHKQAYPYLDTARTMISQLLQEDPKNYNIYLTDRKDINIFLGKYYQKEGDYLQASRCFSDSYLLNDSINILKTSDEYKHILQRFEMDQNDAEISKLKIGIEKQNAIVEISIILTLALLIILVLFVFFYRRISNKNQLLQEKNAIIHEQNRTLEKVNAEKDRLFSIIGHDLKGPSVNLKMLLQSFADKRIPFSEFEKLLPDLLKSSSNLNSTLESLLNWSVMRSNKDSINTEDFDIKTTIDKVIDFLGGSIREKSIQILNHCYSEMVHADKSQVEVIVRNLISNAIKYSFANSIIEINLISKDQEIEIMISDHGTGMPEEEIKQIIDDKTIRSKQGTNGEKGTGLGLKLVKEYVERNKGYFKIESRLNIGTSMTFTLPKKPI